MTAITETPKPVDTKFTLPARLVHQLIEITLRTKLKVLYETPKFSLVAIQNQLVEALKDFNKAHMDRLKHLDEIRAEHTKKYQERVQGIDTLCEESKKDKTDVEKSVLDDEAKKEKEIAGTEISKELQEKYKTENLDALTISAVVKPDGEIVHFGERDESKDPKEYRMELRYVLRDDTAVEVHLKSKYYNLLRDSVDRFGIAYGIFEKDEDFNLVVGALKLDE